MGDEEFAKELASFRALSEMDQAGCLNAIRGREEREKVAEYIFGKAGWRGGVTQGGIFVTAAVYQAINASKKKD